jgi:transcription antitermination factor NusG
LNVGQAVSLCDGPLRGLEGILVEIRNEHRLVVSVNLLRRSTSVTVERSWVALSRNEDTHRFASGWTESRS